MTHDDSLNPEQRQAVEHGAGPLLVVAGAGTGKTRVITTRIARLIETGAAKPEEVLALTFTEKAAREMADRLYELIGWEAFRVPVMTFNAFGVELLARFAPHVGRSIRGGLINDIQKTLLLKQRLSDVELQYYGLQPNMMEFLGRIVSYIGKLQNADITTATYTAYAKQLKTNPGELHPLDVAEQHDLAALYTMYEQIKEETGTFDYYDQLALPLRILDERPNLAQRLAAQYRYVLVDEYQDTSPVQDRLLRSFVPPDGNLFAVGDDDQAIYSFRGAEIDNIISFTAHFAVARPLALVRNYRSGQPILDAAYRLIRGNDPERLEVKLGLDKRLIAASETATVEFGAAASPAAELEGVVTAIADRLEAGEAAGEIAILARSNSVLRTYAKVLRGRGIPYAISTTVDVFEQRELIQLWNLLEWIGDRASDEAVGHLMVGPYIGWQPTQWQPMVRHMRDDLVGAEEALRAAADDGDEAAAGVVEMLDKWREWAAHDSVATLSYRIVFEGGLVDRLKDEASGSQNARIIRVFEDLHRLLEQMQDFETIEPDASLAAYLATYPLPPQLEASEAVGDAEGVQLLTVHASKGLEFDTVYIVNCTARAWAERAGGGGLEVPEQLRKTSDAAPEHEQRRLMYVAATRARKQLFLSAPVATAGGTKQTVSPLITELCGEISLETMTSENDKFDESLNKLQRFVPLITDLPERLPFETSDGWLELGVGDLALYDQDPHDFLVEKVLKISRPFGPQLSFGTAVHGTIQAYYEAQLRHEPITLDELLMRLAELWTDRGYETRHLADLARSRAEDAVRRFYARDRSGEKPVLSVEQPVQLEVAEAKLRLRGRIDATFGTTDGMEVRDFKTGGVATEEAVIKKIKDASTRESFQLRTYALAVMQLTGKPPQEVVLDYVVTGAIGGVSLTDKVLANHRDKLIAMAAKIRAREFTPAPASLFHQPAATRYWGTGDDE